MRHFHWQRAALVAAAAFAISAPAAAQSWRGVNGANVTYVRVNDGGSFAQVAPGRWEQYEPNGRVWARLNEVRRSGDTVLLTDPTRRVEVLLDLRQREVRGTEEGTGRWRRFYTITDADSRRPGGDGRRDVRDRDVRDARDDGRAVEVGPIWNQRDAEAKCTARARELRGEWTGQWWTTQPGRMSVCQIETRGGRGDGGWGRDSMRDVEVGPIWNQRDAEAKCNAKAREIGAEWNGNWSTVRPGVSVCGMRVRGGGGRWEPRDVLREIEVGPIWNQNDAVGKCNGKARELRAEWTGQWRTTVTGRMSVCEIRFR